MMKPCLLWMTVACLLVLPHAHAQRQSDARPKTSSPMIEQQVKSGLPDTSYTLPVIVAPDARGDAEPCEWIYRFERPHRIATEADIRRARGESLPESLEYDHCVFYGQRCGSEAAWRVCQWLLEKRPELPPYKWRSARAVDYTVGEPENGMSFVIGSNGTCSGAHCRSFTHLRSGVVA